MKHIILSIIFLYTAININANSDNKDDLFEIGRMNISISQDNNGNTNPNIQFPITWNENLFSELSYSSYSTTTVQDLISATGKSSSYTKNNDLALSMNYLYNLTKEHTFTVGMLLNYKNSSGNEFGYFEVNATTNSVNVDVKYRELKVGIKGDYTYRGDQIPLNFRLGFILYPLRKLNLEQNLVMSGDIGEGFYKSTSTQNISYEFYIAIKYPIYDDRFFFGIDAYLNNSPLEYDSIVLDPDTNKYATANITHEESISKVNYKLLYKQFKDSNLNYVLGYSKQRVHIKLENNENNQDQDMLILGLERRF